MTDFQPSVCIDAIFEGRPVAEAMQCVKSCGIDAIEFWGWWDKDIEALVEAKEANGLSISACCTKFISLVDPNLRADYLSGLAASIKAAKELGTRTLISQVGGFSTRDPTERAA